MTRTLALTVVLLASSSIAQVNTASPPAKSADVVELFVDRGETFARAGTKQGLAVGTVLSVLGPPIGDTNERRTLGNATVLEVWPSLARVSLDQTAQASKEAQVIRLSKPKAAAPKAAAPKAKPAAPAVAAAPALPTPPPPPPELEVVPYPEPAAAPAAPAVPGLTGRAEVGAMRVTVYNKGSIDWTHCELRLPSNRRYVLQRLAAGDQEGIMLFKFTQDGIPYDRPNESLKVKCEQGESTFKL